MSLVNAGGTTLDVRYEPRTSPAPPQQLSPGGVADLEVSWSNWCGPKPGYLTVHITLPNGGGTIAGSFNGPPDYGFVPGCTSPGRPSVIEFIDYVP